ncbi:hypothetical protein LguiB_004494 [Lonicera macranthoides]
MGISLSVPFADIDELNSRFESFLVRSISFGSHNGRTELRSLSFGGRDSKKKGRNMILEGSLSFNGKELDTTLSFRSPCSNFNEKITPISNKSVDLHDQLTTLDSAPEKNLQSPLVELGKNRHEAALKLQKTYKSFRTRRQLADCAVIVEQRWWKLLDFAMLKRSSISFFEIEKPETAVSRWSRARTRAAKVGKGLSKDEKARKLALQHWLEAIDPRHRYGHNLQFYYAKWLHCESKQPFFYWLDIGEGKEVNVERCSRSKLQQQCIKYLGPIERKAYEVVVEDGKFIYKESGNLIDTRSGPEDTKWIFVLSTSKIMYIGMKKKGMFQHSSFLAGGATLSAGRLVVIDGILKAVWPHSGHYLPTQENFEAFIMFLKEHGVDLSTVQKSPKYGEESLYKKENQFSLRNCISDPDFARRIQEPNANISSTQKPMNLRPPATTPPRRLSSKITTLEIPNKENIIQMFKNELKQSPQRPNLNTQNDKECESDDDGYETAEEYLSEVEFMVSKHNLFDKDKEEFYQEPIPKEKISKRIKSHKMHKSYQLAEQLSCKWTTGAGPRIGCVRDYPSELQARVLEEVSLSPRKISRSSPPRMLIPSNFSRRK